ncbi:hypothetical protein RJT34_25175 [Clitoria ternatea]|uniref:Uncharacterized protein n=1 Tax=Clitoria ternatea TaxID=43366 RepID=A0AAN9FXI8_CLITE
MGSVFVQSKSKSSNTSEEENRENRCYYPGCKKDANCNCAMCLASINAMLDLMPNSIHKSTLTKLSASKPNLECTPISFDASLLSTPRSSAFCISSSSPVIKSCVRSNSTKKMGNRNKVRVSCVSFLRLVLLGLGLLLCVDLVFPLMVKRVLQPSLSPDVVKRVGEKCSQVHDLNGKLRLLQKELASSVAGDVSSCSVTDSLWEINQEGLLLNSRCILYKSATEEVTIWGWPLQTSGLLTNGFSYTTFTVLSGRVTLWNGRQARYLIRKANTSWVQQKWGTSVVQLDPSTWVLEYQRSSIYDGTRLYSAVLEFLKHRMAKTVSRLKKNFWLFVAFEHNQYKGYSANNGPKTPT